MLGYPSLDTITPDSTLTVTPGHRVLTKLPQVFILSIGLYDSVNPNKQFITQLQQIQRSWAC